MFNFGLTLNLCKNIEHLFIIIVAENKFFFFEAIN